MDWSSINLQAGQAQLAEAHIAQPELILADLSLLVYGVVAVTCIITLITIYVLIQDRKINKMIQEELGQYKGSFVPAKERSHATYPNPAGGAGVAGSTNEVPSQVDYRFGRTRYELLDSYIDQLGSRQN